MEVIKPQTVEEYLKWLHECHKVDISSRTRTYFESVATRIKDEFIKHQLWGSMMDQWNALHQAYQVKTGYPLFLTAQPPEVIVKSYDSFIQKTFRKNIVNNRNWPDPPKGGWILPSNWFSSVNDIVRTLVVVKYLDGVDFLVEKLGVECKTHTVKGNNYFEARDDGYYAAHFYVRLPCEIPKESWDTETISACVEVQITTQLQEVIRKLLHEHYEKRRGVVKPPPMKWQWDYRGEDFSANYLGHILHYLEGTILEIRDKSKKP